MLSLSDWARSTSTVTRARFRASKKVRMFAGYASWAPGQLDAELLDEAWIVVDAEAEDIHATDPDELWWRVIARQPGPVNRLRFYPRDPSDN